MEISLALGGGGSKGFAHLGVLRCLEKQGYKICAVAGTSVGGIVAAIYAAGYSPQEMIEKFQQVDQSQFYRTPAWRWTGAVRDCRTEPVIERNARRAYL